MLHSKEIWDIIDDAARNISPCLVNGKPEQSAENAENTQMIRTPVQCFFGKSSGWWRAWHALLLVAIVLAWAIVRLSRILIVTAATTGRSLAWGMVLVWILILLLSLICWSRDGTRDILGCLVDIQLLLNGRWDRLNLRAKLGFDFVEIVAILPID